MSWQCSKVQEHPKNFTYIVECSDGTLYTGWTNNLEHRVETHNVGKGAKYTKSRRPVKLVYFEMYSSKEEAMRREWEIKQLSRTEKWKLIKAKEESKTDFSNRHNNVWMRKVCFFVKMCRTIPEETRYFDLQNNFILL